MSQQNVAANATDTTITAQDYADMGFAPIRLYGLRADGSCQCGGGDECAVKRRIGKHPVGGGWQNAPIDAQAADRHLANGGNVGLRMGDQPCGERYVALDEDAPGALASGEALWGPLPETLTSRTGSGGRHCVYSWPSDRPYPTNKVRSNGFVFDVRGHGAQIVVEPSRNANGAYAWTHFDVPAPLPAAWVEALLADSGKRTGPRKAGKLPHVETADADERTAVAVAALLPFWEPPDPSMGRRNRLRALGSMLAEWGWPDEQIAAFATALPMARDVAARVGAALEGATARRAEVPNTIGYGELERWSPEALAALEAVAKDPREPEGFTGVWAPCFARMFERMAENQASAAQAERDAKQAADGPIYEPRAEASISITPRSTKRKRKLTGWVARMLAIMVPAEAPAPAQAAHEAAPVPVSGAAHNASALEATDDWYTMADDLDRVRAVLGTIDLDPASCPAANASVGAGRIYTIADNGLQLPWAGRVYCNPPFSKGMRDLFVDKAIASAAAGAEIVFLCDFDHSTAWCQRLMRGCSAYALPKGRLKFWKPGGAKRSPKCGQIVAYFGPHVGRFRSVYETSAQVTLNGDSK